MREPHSHSSPLPLLAHTQGGRENGRDIIEMNRPPQCRSGVCLCVCSQGFLPGSLSAWSGLGTETSPMCASGWVAAKVIVTQQSQSNKQREKKYSETKQLKAFFNNI